MREMNFQNDVIVGLGSNINPLANIEKAIAKIKARFSAIACSPLVKTEPIGFKAQAHFQNGAVRFKTDLSASELKDWLLGVETALGRVRTQNKNGPRTIDLDILVWNGKIVDEDVEERDFLKNAIETLQPGLIKSHEIKEKDMKAL